MLRFELSDVFYAHPVCGEETEERSAPGCSFDCWPPAGFFPFHDAYNRGNRHAGFPRGLDGCDG